MSQRVRHPAGFNEQIPSLYACGMSMRDICSYLADTYGVEVSPGLISRVTDSATDELATTRRTIAGGRKRCRRLPSREACRRLPGRGCGPAA
ncbi:transposase [Streptomyces sp. YGL11-2]|uniref:transposase n=1 Tax=Streptomyces sp. YGL11-2 TaxID=3414028 RepID=UPI003CF6C41F